MREPTSSPRVRWVLVLALALAALGASSPLEARADDAAAEFNAANNFSFQRWSYGWSTSLGGTVTLYNVATTDAFQLQYWRRIPNDDSYVLFNPTALPKTPVAGTTIPSKTLALQPGNSGHYAVVRWLAYGSGTYSIAARFTARSTNNSQREVAVLHGGQVVFSRALVPASQGNVVSMSARLEVNAGENVDLVVGPAVDGYTSDITGLDATILWEPPDSVLHGPIQRIGSDRFVVGRWGGVGFDEIAFNPIQRRIASQGRIQSLCGNLLSAGPLNGVGLAWDPVETGYWQVTGDRRVRRWSAGGTLLDTVFTIPQTFNVPGTGLDTLESVRGIALDSSYVYLVDAGPNPGEIPSNAWFKFTRAGTPVKSSKATDLLAHLDADPDALVDDIVWVPPTSPVLPGRLLVALEHSGFQVLDTEGNFVSAFRWSGAALAPRDATKLYGRLSAFAGFTVDPLSGALYLADNDTGTAQVWTPLPYGAPARYALTTGWGQPWLVEPTPGCAVKLWEDYPSAIGLPFGFAYRESERILYTVDFNTGDLWRVDPRVGNAARVGSTGFPNIWGVTYDAERDLLYGGIEVGSPGLIRVITIDPATAEGALLSGSIGHGTTDLAFSPVDHALYGVSSGPPTPQLIRVNRNTGVGTVVGPTVYVRGIEYDPGRQKLLGVSIEGKIYAIDPNTAVADSVGLFADAPNEGLAVVTVPILPELVGVEAAVRPATRFLRLWPNPARAPVTIAFELERPAHVRAEVFDVQGRRVREIARRPMEAGLHQLAWKGDDAQGRAVDAGVFFVRVEAEGHSRVTRLARIR